MATKLIVRPNPFAAFDHNGNLAGVVAVDAYDHVRYADPFSGVKEKNRRWENRKYVGARLEVRAVRPQRGDALPNGDQDTVFVFDTETDVELPVTEHYKMLVRTGGLLAANLETAIECGIDEKDYLEPAAILDASRDTLTAEWEANYPDAKLPNWAASKVSAKAADVMPSNVKQLKKASA